MRAAAAAGGGGGVVNCPGVIGRNPTARFRLKGDGETARERSNFRDRKRACTPMGSLDSQDYVNRRSPPPPPLRRAKNAVGGLVVECGQMGVIAANPRLRDGPLSEKTKWAT